MHWWVLVCWFRSLYEFDGLANAQPVRHRRMELARSSPTPTRLTVVNGFVDGLFLLHHLKIVSIFCNAEKREANRWLRELKTWVWTPTNETLINTYSHGSIWGQISIVRSKALNKSLWADDRNLAQHCPWLYVKTTLIYSLHPGHPNTSLSIQPPANDPHMPQQKMLTSEMVNRNKPINRDRSQPKLVGGVHKWLIYG